MKLPGGRKKKSLEQDAVQQPRRRQKRENESYRIGRTIAGDAFADERKAKLERMKERKRSKRKNVGVVLGVVLIIVLAGVVVGHYVAESLVKSLIKADIAVKDAKVAILGFTFKENCPDTRNTKVIDIYRELKEYGITPLVVDPAADAAEAKRLYGIEFGRMEDVQGMDAVIIAVSHTQFLSLTQEQLASFYNKDNGTKVLLDLKGILDRSAYTEDSHWLYWRL